MIRKSGAGILIHGPGTSSWLFRLHALMWHEAKWVSTQERRTERKILKRGEKGGHGRGSILLFHKKLFRYKTR